MHIGYTPWTDPRYFMTTTFTYKPIISCETCGGKGYHIETVDAVEHYGWFGRCTRVVERRAFKMCGHCTGKGHHYAKVDEDAQIHTEQHTGKGDE